MMKKEDGRIDWNRSAQDIHNHVRGLDPWPGAYTTINGELLKLAETSPEAAEGLAGSVIAADKNGVCVACGSGSLRIQQLQLAGRKRLAAADFLRGCPLEAGAMME
jgi:methionyl-tRNA formyltransferase